MALRLLGPGPIDLHAGGVDLVFPHHENEIAQAEGATNEQFSRFWFHVEHLFVEHEKMSKSLGNFYTVPDIVAKGHRPSALRYLLLSSHYRKQLNFTWAGMDQADESIGRIMNCVNRLDIVTGEDDDGNAKPAPKPVAPNSSELETVKRDLWEATKKIHFNDPKKLRQWLVDESGPDPDKPLEEITLAEAKTVFAIAKTKRK
jgi:cysteinyl-tRNA synthetase